MILIATSAARDDQAPIDVELREKGQGRLALHALLWAFGPARFWRVDAEDADGLAAGKSQRVAINEGGNLLALGKEDEPGDADRESGVERAHAPKNGRRISQ